MSSLTVCLLSSWTPSLAGSSDPDTDRFYHILFLAECVGVLDPFKKRVLAALRKKGEVPPFDIQWCIDNNAIPPAQPGEQEGDA